MHVAKGHDGRMLAVKVQHAGLRETAVADVATISFIVRAVRFIFPVSLYYVYRFIDAS